jgi:hypothetical protein
MFGAMSFLHPYKVFMLREIQQPELSEFVWRRDFRSGYDFWSRRERPKMDRFSAAREE